jgi:hypothetical protein
MKIAVLFHGIIGGMDGKNGYGKSSNSYHCSKFWHNNVYGDLDHDIFIHSWSKEAEQEIVDAFKPTKYIIEEQPTFGFYIPEETKHHDNPTSMLFKNISRFTSAYKVYNMMLEHQKETGIEYDYCILSRMDLLFFNKINLNNMKKDTIYICNNPFPNWQNPKINNIIFDPFLIMDNNMMGQFCNLIIDVQNKKYINSMGNSHYLCTDKIRDMGYIDNIEYVCTRFSDMDVYRFLFLDNANDGRPEEFDKGANAARMFDILKSWEIKEHNNNQTIISIKNI